MNNLTQTVLINFHNQGVTHSNVTFFGRELDIPMAKGTACHRMLVAFGRQQKLRREPSAFGRSVQEIVRTNKWKKEVELANLVNSSLTHINFEPKAARATT